MSQAEGQFQEKRWLALILLCSAQFVVVLDASIVNVALPSIGRALDFSQENLPWVVNAYVLTFGGFLLLGGPHRRPARPPARLHGRPAPLRASPRWPPGFAATEGQLIAARAAQGLGAAIISPAALSIVTTTFSDGAERNKALGVWGAVAGSGGAAGRAARRRPHRRPRLGVGALGQRPGQPDRLRALAPSLIAESRAEARTRAFDVAGAVTITAGLSILVYALVDANSAGWGSTQTIGLIGARGAAAGGLRRDRAALAQSRSCRSRSSASGP